MSQWWANLSALNQGFYLAAIFFSGLFLWQLIATLIGIAHGGDGQFDAGGGHVAVDHGMDQAGATVGDHPEMTHSAVVDNLQTVTSFKLLTLRSVLAFFLLFCWATALYLNQAMPLTQSMLYALGWGVVAMVIVSLVFYFMRSLTETGTARLATCVGTTGTVYLDVPQGGEGEARLTVSGVVTHVRVRSADAKPIKSGTAVKVTRLLGTNIVEVVTE